MCLSRLKLELLGYGILLALLTTQPTLAQVIPDNTLPNNSIVQPGCTNCDITGGTTVGTNLFHSFQQFSIPTGGSAYFDNAANIENIISRVTGSFRSDIDGIIQANPAANLFLINPNGIVFGPNASLDVRGSFIATTARSLVFADGTQFSAVNPQATPLLTVSVPLGLQFGPTPGEIRNELLSSLSVEPDKTLALVGGPINLPGGILSAPSGRVELGSVSDNSFVKLTAISKGWELSYEGAPSFQDIRLSQAALIDVVGDSGGDIQVQGRRISIEEGSQIASVSLLEGQAGNLRIAASDLVELIGSALDPFPTGIFNEVEGNSTGAERALTISTKRLVVRGGAQVSTKTLGTGQGIALTVIALESVELIGNSSTLNLPSGLFARTDNGATGDGGALSVQTGRLIVQDGAQISTDTFGSGRAGNLSVNASNSIELIGRTADNQASVLSTQVGEDATGDAGELMISTRQLTVKDGAQILTVARSGGNGGLLTVNATDSVLLSGASSFVTASPLDNNRSGLFISAEKDATGNVGNLNLTTDQLTVEDGARISADNLGTFNTGGNATLSVRNLVIRSGGQVRAGSFADGTGGLLTINAKDTVRVVGIGIINGTQVPSELFTDATSSGTAGNLIITTNSLAVQDGARITVSSSGTGQAGSLVVKAQTVELQNRGSIQGEAQSVDGGNLQFELQGNLLLREGSLISTTAGTARSGGNGGNIFIRAPFVIATPFGNSDIITNAFTGSGGTITISTNQIFGLEERSGSLQTLRSNRTNDISASSDFGNPGAIFIQDLTVDPSRGLTALPINPIDPAQQIAQTCGRGSRQASSFVVTGRGGLPPAPGEKLRSASILTPWGAVADADKQRSTSREVMKTSRVETNQPSGAIVETQGWIRDKDGTIVLVAQAPTITPYGFWSGTTPCDHNQLPISTYGAQ